MYLHFEELFGKIIDFNKTEAKTETVIGEEFELREFKCIPVIKVGMGFAPVEEKLTKPSSLQIILTD